MNVTVEKIDDINIVISGEVEKSEIEANVKRLKEESTDRISCPCSTNSVEREIECRDRDRVALCNLFLYLYTLHPISIYKTYPWKRLEVIR